MTATSYTNEMYHHGIKGMKWYVRRFQNKDGSLTPAGKKRYSGDSEGTTESAEETRARVLKSTNASEIYKHRDLLTTAEINERLNRIDTEKRLANVAESTKKSGYDYVDNALKFGRKVNEVYEFTNTPVMKALKKQLGISGEETAKRLGLEEVYAKRDKLSDKQLTDALKRATTEKAIKKILDENADALNKAKEKVAADEAKAETKSEKKVDTKSEPEIKTASAKDAKTGEEIEVEVIKPNMKVNDVSDSVVNRGEVYVKRLTLIDDDIKHSFDKEIDMNNHDWMAHRDHKYIKREWIKGKWRYWYDDQGKTEVTKKYNEYSSDDHEMYITTEKKVKTNSVFTPMNKTEITTDSKTGEKHKTVTDYEGKLERAIQTGANFVANAIHKKAFDIAARREMKKIQKDLLNKARNSK